MMVPTNDIAKRLAVRLIGEVDHPDFHGAIELIRADAQLVWRAATSPDLIVVAQNRPGVISSNEIEELRRAAPLAGIIALLGSWCEGETRTGRPWLGVDRLYWYEFPAWWRRQLALSADGRCPDWARWGDVGFRISDFGLRMGTNSHRGLVVIRVALRETADVLADVLQHASYATAWERPGFSAPLVRGTAAGVWDGAQLNESEAGDLAAFCRRLKHNGAPVIALLDFPRCDRVERALEMGATTVLGKPWLNSDLVATLQSVSANKKFARAA